MSVVPGVASADAEDVLGPGALEGLDLTDDAIAPGVHADGVGLGPANVCVDDAALLRGDDDAVPAVPVLHDVDLDTG